MHSIIQIGPVPTEKMVAWYLEQNSGGLYSKEIVCLALEERGDDNHYFYSVVIGLIIDEFGTLSSAEYLDRFVSYAPKNTSLTPPDWVWDLAEWKFRDE